MKVQVNLSDEMVAKVDNFAKRVGLSRSRLCAFCVGAIMDSLENANNLVFNSFENLTEKLEKK